MSETVRRVPIQDRSRQRVERILAAAVEILGEVGFEAATMEGIAQRAETSIGSLYQFFPNKVAIFDEVAGRYLTGARALFDQLWTPELLSAPWETLIDRFVDAFALFDLSDPAFRVLMRNVQASPGFIRAGEAMNREVAGRIKSAIEHYAPQLGAEELEVVSVMVVEITAAMLFYSARHTGPLGPRLVEESKTVLKRYLAPMVTRPTPLKKKRRGTPRG